MHEPNVGPEREGEGESERERERENDRRKRNGGGALRERERNEDNRAGGSTHRALAPARRRSLFTPPTRRIPTSR